MSGPVKIALGVLGLLTSLLVFVIVLIQLELTPERVRKTVIPLAEEKLQRKVEVGEISIGLFSGVSLDNLKVMQRDGSDAFISARSLSLSFQLWPLLSGRILIDEVRLDQPRIVVIRNPDGSLNFSDLLPLKSADHGEAAAEKSHLKPPETASDTSINLLVNEVVVSAGELLFIDRQQHANSPYRYSLKQLNLQAEQITFDQSFPLKISALLNGSKIELSGEFDIAEMAGDFDLQLAPLDLIPFAPYYREGLPGKLGTAILAVNLEAVLTADKVSSKGKISLTNVDLVLNDLPDAAFQQSDLLVEYAINYRMDQQTLALSTLLVDLNGIALGVEGEIQLAGAEPNLNVALLLDRFDLRKLSQGLPTGLTTELQKYSLTGLVDGKIELAGRAGDGAGLLKSARFELDQVAANLDGSWIGINGSFRYAGQVAQADKLELTFAEQPVWLSFTATDLLKDLIRGEFIIEADSLDLNRILPAPAGEGAEIDQRSTTKSADRKMPPVERRKSIAEDIGPFEIPIEMKGKLAVNKLIYRKLEMTKVQADLLLKDNHLVLSKLRSDIGGGDLQVVADLDLGVKGLAYSGQMTLSRANLISLVPGLFPQAEQSVSGLLQWQNNFSGRGTLPENLLEQLQAKGAVRIGNGKVTGSPLLEQLSSFLGSSDLKVLSFEEFSGNYHLRNGVAQLAADLDSSKVKLRPQGTVGLDGALDLKLDARLAPTLLNRLGADKNLQKIVTDVEGWGIFPLKIKGTLNQPKIGFDSKQLQKLAAERATQEVTRQLLKKLGADQGGEQDPVKQLLEGTLNRLFGN